MSAVNEGVQRRDEKQERLSYTLPERSRGGFSLCDGVVGRAGKAGPQQQDEGLWKTQRAIFN